MITTFTPGPNQYKFGFKLVATDHCHVSSSAEELFISTITSVPSAIWKEQWVPTMRPYLGLSLSSLENISDDVFEIATSGRTMEAFEVHALDMAGLVDAFKNILADAVMSGNFTQVPSTERGFYL